MRTLLVLLGLAGFSHANDDPDATVFLGPLGRDTVFAPANNSRVILSGVTRKWNGVLAELRGRGYDKTVRLGKKMDAAFRELARIRPGFVAVVVPPDRLDVNFHFEFLERAARLDSDPFVDFSFGYITGATPAEALGSLRALRKDETRHTVLEFGPTRRAYGPTRPGPHKTAKGYTVRRYGHAANAADVAATLAKLEGIGIYKAWGHGYPAGVYEGLQGSALRKSTLDLDGALYFSGPCYCGVPSGWFDPSGGLIKRRVLALEDSFVLAAIKARAGAIFAGLDPDRGETNHHEFEHLLTRGGPLGDASKSTYDDVVLAYRRTRLKLPRYKECERRPHASIHETMIAGGACRALFGDPAATPVKAAAPDPFVAEVHKTDHGLELRWSYTKDLGRYWLPIDVYRAEGRWTHRLRFTVELPRGAAHGIRGFKALQVTKDGHALPAQWVTAGLEGLGERVRAHVMVVFPWNLEKKALLGGQLYEARFLLSGTSR